MAAPANDTRAAAETVTVGPYWGTASGTTVEATEDAGGPVDGFDARDVFYEWASLPAGNVFFYIKPATPTVYFEAAAFSGAATSWTAADPWVGFGFHSGDGEAERCYFQAAHTGGPFSLCVYSYGDEFDFEFGWGHELDATASHWGAVQSESPVSRSLTFSLTATAKRGVKQSYVEPVGGTTVPSGADNWSCGYANAKDGVVHISEADVYGCEYLGPGTTGTTTSGFNDRTGAVGQAYHAQGLPSIPPSPTTTGRGDRVSVDQTPFVWRINPAHLEPLEEGSSTPDSWNDYAFADGARDSGFVWGYEYQSSNYGITDLALGTWTLTDPHPESDADIDVGDSCTVTLRALPQSMVWATFATRNDAANRVTILDNSGSPSATVTFILAGDIPAATLDDLVDGANDVTIADPTPFLIQSSDEDNASWIAAVLVAEETINGTPPTYGDPPFAAGEFRSVGVRDLARSGTSSYKTTFPDWRPYLGFPFDEVPVVAGWHVGREAMTGSGAW